MNEQAKQTERNQRALIQAERASRNGNQLRFMADPGNIDAYLKGRAGAPDLSLTQFQQYYAAVRAMLTSHEDTFFQHQNKLVDDAAFKSSRAVLRQTFSFPGNRALWRRLRVTYEETFRDSVDQLVSEVEVVDPRLADEEVEIWHKDVADELLRVRAQ
jgi:hypothetical protein